jgi:hypothetical protein
VSPKRHLYTVLVSPDAAVRVRRHDHVRRVSSNPTIGALEPRASAAGGLSRIR